MYKIVLSKLSEKFLEKSENLVFERISKKLDKLKENPFPSDCKRVEGQVGKVFRVRVGDYRVLYEVLHQDVVVHIIKIDKRSNVYE